MSADASPTAPADRRAVLSRRIRLLVAATISYNVVEAAVAIGEGARVSSTALIGFGLDSVIEVASAAAVAWQFAAPDPASREKAALRVIACSFFALAAYVTVDAVRSLLGAADARHSAIGIALTAASVVIMPVLSHVQRRAGRELGSVSRGGGFEADPAVHVPVGRGPRRAGGEQHPRVVVGRSGCRTGDRGDRRARGTRRLAR